MPRSELRSATG